MDHSSPVERALARGRLLAADPMALSPDEAIDALVVLQAEQSRLSAREAELLVRAAGAQAQQREVTVDDGRPLVLSDEVREEVASALRRTPGQVYDDVMVARLLAGPLRRTWQALAAGLITSAQARALAQQAARLEPDADVKRFGMLCEELQDRVLASAERSTVGETRARARRVVEGIDPAAATRRRYRARRRIDVGAYAEDDGVGVLFARLPIADAARLHAAVCARAASPDLLTACEATAGQSRAAALVDLVLGSSPTTAVTTAVEVQVTVDLGTLLGLADRPVTIGCGSSGREPMGMEQLRDLLDDPEIGATVRRLVLDPVTGRLLDRGRRAYAIPVALRAFIVARDGVCRFPGCRRRASSCQVDHATAWADGGRTDAANLGSLCVRHYQLKTHGRWRITRSAADGCCTWISPAGREYHHEPDPLDLDPASDPGPRPESPPPEPPPEPPPPF